MSTSTSRPPASVSVTRRIPNLTPLLAATLSGLTSVYGANLIVNGDAEAAAGSADGFLPVAVPGWSVNGAFLAVQYDVGGGFPASTDPGPASRGRNFFAGGPDNSSSSATQIIDLSPFSTSIDVGAGAFALSGYFGGFDGQNDNAVLSVIFRDSGGGVLGTSSIGGVTAGDRTGLTGLLLRTTTSTIPTGTRDALLLLQMTRTDGSYNDGYADNLSLEVTIIPEPSVCWAVGVFGLSFAVYRRMAR